MKLSLTQRTGPVRKNVGGLFDSLTGAQKEIRYMRQRHPKYAAPSHEAMIMYVAQYGDHGYIEPIDVLLCIKRWENDVLGM